MRRPALADARLPPMVLPTLVENAIKHGLSPLPEGGRIDIRARGADGRLIVEVADDGAGFSATAGSGVGLGEHAVAAGRAVRVRRLAVAGNSGAARRDRPHRFAAAVPGVRPMSVVLPRSPALESGLRGVPRWWRAWSAMNRRHLAAWLLASASMAVVDLTAVVDKLHMPGVSKIMALDWVTSLIIFGFALLAWVAAVDGAPSSGHTRNVRVGWAIVVAAVLAACIAVPLMRMLGDRPAVA